MQVIVQSLVDGLLFGAFYAMAGVTFSIIYDVTKVFHIAYGAIGTLGVYIAVAMTGGDKGTADVLLAIAAGALASAALTAAVVAVVYQPLVKRGADKGATFVASLAAGLVIQAVVVLIFGPNNRSFPVDEFVRRFDLGYFSVSYFHIVSLLVGVAMSVGVAVLLNRTPIGYQARAIASNREQAEIVGIRSNLVETGICALAGGLSVIPMVLIGMNGAVVATGGTQLALFAILATIAGGSGSVFGTAGVGLGLGILGGLTGAILPGEWSTTAVFAFALFIIVTRPIELLGRLFRKDLQS